MLKLNLFATIVVIIITLLNVVWCDQEEENGTNSSYPTTLPSSSSSSSTAANDQRASTLKKYFKLRESCPFDLNTVNNTADCAPTADFLLCFPETPANRTIKFKCPYVDDLPFVINDGNHIYISLSFSIK